MIQKINLIGPLKLNVSKIDFNCPSYFVDGGLRHKALFENYLGSIGDNDSSNTCPDILLDTEKDDSDYLHALREIISKTNRIKVHGFWGGRFDHQLALIGDTFRVLEDFSSKIVEVFQLESNYSLIFSSHKNYQYQVKHNFSLFTLKQQEILYFNCKYPDKEYAKLIKPISSNGISNFGYQEIIIKAQRPIMLMQI